MAAMIALLASVAAVSPCTYTNPVLDTDFPDPTVIRGGDGHFYGYATMGNGVRLQGASSPDLCTWTYHGEILNPPAWLGPNSWAPHVVFDGSRYLLYFAASNGTTGNMCIGLATSASPLGPFSDALGVPLLCGSTFTTIDPMVMSDSGSVWMFWGSDFVPIHVQALAANHSALAPRSAPSLLVAPSPAPYESLVEGTWVVRSPAVSQPSLIMFYSGDNCCGNSAHYAVMAARADNATGPWTKLGKAGGGGSGSSSVILQESEAWQAPGHNSLVWDDAGVAWMMYHAYAGADRGARKLCMDRVDFNGTAGGWSDWPVVGGGRGTPSDGPQTGPVVQAPRV